MSDKIIMRKEIMKQDQVLIGDLCKQQKVLYMILEEWNKLVMHHWQREIDIAKWVLVCVGHALNTDACTKHARQMSNMLLCKI